MAILAPVTETSLIPNAYRDPSGYYWSISDVGGGSYLGTELSRAQIAGPNVKSVQAEIDQYAARRSPANNEYKYNTTALVIAGGAGLLAGYLVSKIF